MDPQGKSGAEKPWYASFPAPQSTADFISRERLLAMLRHEKKKPVREFLAIDLRRTDHEVRYLGYWKLCMAL